MIREEVVVSKRFWKGVITAPLIEIGLASLVIAWVVGIIMFLRWIL